MPSHGSEGSQRVNPKVCEKFLKTTSLMNPPRPRPPLMSIPIEPVKTTSSIVTFCSPPDISDPSAIPATPLLLIRLAWMFRDGSAVATPRGPLPLLTAMQSSPL